MALGGALDRDKIDKYNNIPLLLKLNTQPSIHPLVIPSFHPSIHPTSYWRQYITFTFAESCHKPRQHFVRDKIRYRFSSGARDPESAGPVVGARETPPRPSSRPPTSRHLARRAPGNHPSPLVARATNRKCVTEPRTGCR